MKIRLILVPLDGSRLAEAALPAACSLARTMPARLALLHTLERDPPDDIHGEPHLRNVEAAATYLGELAARLARASIDAEVRVHQPPVGDIASALDAEAREAGADLIVMCAHGRSNLRDRLVGRIAARTLRMGAAPILLRTVRRPDASGFRLRRLLVPLELDQDIAPALDAARALAVPYGAAVTLLSVPEVASPAAERLLPSTAALARDFDRDELRRRLDEVVAALRADVPEVDAVVGGERPTEAIVSLSATLPADLVIVMTDPGEPRPRWVEPSVAQELLARHELTLLLVKRGAPPPAP